MLGTDVVLSQTSLVATSGTPVPDDDLEGKSLNRGTDVSYGTSVPHATPSKSNQAMVTNELAGHPQKPVQTVQRSPTDSEGVLDSTGSHMHIRDPPGAIDHSSGRVGAATVSKDLHAHEPRPQAAQNSIIPNSFDNDAASTTAIRGGVLGDSHARLGTELNKDLPAEPTFNSTQSHSGRDSGIRGTNFTVNEATNEHETQHVPKNHELAERSFPLGHYEAPIGSSSLHTESSSKNPKIANSPAATESSNSNLKFQAGTLRGQNLEREFEGNASNDTDLGAYGPESWQHDHHKHGHEFVPVKQHETMMGALLDPHAPDSSKNLTEPHSHLGRETLHGRTALAGAGTVMGKSRENPTSSTNGANSTLFTEDVAEDRQLGQQLAPATTSKSATTEQSRADESGHHGSEALNIASDHAVHPARANLSGPVHKSSVLNRIDPRVKELPPTTMDATGSRQPQISSPFSSSLPYSPSKLNPRIDDEAHRDATPNQRYTGEDAATTGLLGRATFASAGHETGNYSKPSSGQESIAQSHNRGFMGVGDTGFDHDRAELDPQRTSFAPPSATTQALHPTSPQNLGAMDESERAKPRPATRRAESHSGSDAILAPQYHYGPDATVVDTGAVTTEEIRHHRDQGESNAAVSNTDPLSGESTQQSHPPDQDLAAVGMGTAAAGEIYHKKEKSRAEFSKQEAEHLKSLEKEHEKEAKALEKEHKKEDKAIAKEHKKEEKAIAQQQNEEARRDKAVTKQQKEHEKEVKALDKEQGQAGKNAAKEQKKSERHEGETVAAAAAAEQGHEENDKHLSKEDKRHEKMHAALEKAHSREEKQFEKSRKEHDKESNEGHGEKKHKGFLGLFHRDKKPGRAVEEEELENRGHSNYGLTGAKPAELGVVAPSAYEMTEHEKQLHEKHERNRLHKASSPFLPP